MIKIESNNGDINEFEIEGNEASILADLGVIVNSVVFAIAETPEDRIKLFDDFIRLMTGAFEIVYREDKQ